MENASHAFLDAVRKTMRHRGVRQLGDSRARYQPGG
jgi:hypothetical protein